jgi:hypothetical protein
MREKKKISKPRKVVPFNTGTRTHKAEKGKGSYSRKKKNAKQ